MTSSVQFSAQAQPGGTWQSEGEPVRRLVVTLNKSRTFRLDKPFATAVVGAPDIADVLPISDQQLYIQGKKVGTTNLSVFDQGQRLVSVLDVEVTVDTATLQEKIQASTGSRGIRVTSSGGQVVLSGKAIDAVAAERAVALAKDFAPGGVINALSVAQSQQVLLKVRFLEVSRSAERDLGVNWNGNNAAGTRGGTTGLGWGAVNAGPCTGSNCGNAAGIPIFQSPASLIGSGSQPFGVFLANVVNGGTNIEVLVSALETQGLVRRLAEPNLMALSGDTAKFLAGGEFPVPIAATSANGLVTPTIEYKPFGVLLSFTPVVLNNGIINLRIAPEVSELDTANTVTISGTTVPALIKRDALTTVELRDGQSFAIAGLLQSDSMRNRSQLPWLGSVPVLGALFSSVSYQKKDTDLVIIVTPHLVQPAAPGQHLATPLDHRLPSNDVDFFVNGQTDVPKNFTHAKTGKVQGPYGHLIPSEPDPGEPVSGEPPSQQ
ncbi:MAG: type II and III secretion system protein family protein [Bradyrhizobiaceae bacterium]|nr:type II and III secretion system protein family protein [Bradyrhizobiaceae bacterium]